VALVTGASRGIGRVAALALAGAGFDVAITARTVHEGDGRADPSSVLSRAAPVPIPGSLDTTAAEVGALGRRALPLRMDLLDRAQVLDTPAAVLAEWGRIDVLCNNAIYEGPGTLDRVLDLDPDTVERLVRGNYVHQLLLTQQVLRHMVERGSGRIVDMASGSARLNPPAPPGQGGWGIAYSASKAAFGRVAGGIEAEFGARGVHAFNLDPGNVITERRRAMSTVDEFEAFGSVPVELVGAAVAWLATSAEAAGLGARWLVVPKLAAEYGLLAEDPSAG